jgi:hypothetical protein
VNDGPNTSCLNSEWAASGPLLLFA